MKKHFTQIVMLLVAVFFALSAKAEEGVVLTLTDGTQVGFAFSARPKVAMGSELTLTADGNSVSYNYSEVKSMTFGEVQLTDIKETATSTNPVNFKLQSDQLLVSGLPIGETVAVYNLSGQQLEVVRQTAEGAVLNLPLTQKGVLIVRTSTGVSYKVIVK